MATISFGEFRASLAAGPGSKLNIAELVRDSVRELTGVDVADGDRMQAESAAYFAGVTALVDATPDEVLLDYLVFRLGPSKLTHNLISQIKCLPNTPRSVLQLIPSTTSQMKRLHRVFSSVLTGNDIPPPRFDGDPFNLTRSGSIS